MNTVGGGVVRFEGITVNAEGACATPGSLLVCWGARVMERVDVLVGQTLYVADGDEVAPGAALVQPWSYARREASCWGADTLQALLNARLPRGCLPAAIAPCDATVESLSPRGVSLVDDHDRPRWIRARRGALALVRVGDRVRAGDALTAGWRSHHRLLRAWGVERLCAHLLDELQPLVDEAEAGLSRAHLSLLLRAMTDWRRVTDAGESELRRHAVVSREEFERAARRARSRGARAPEATPALRGIAWMARRARGL
ncbi:MAG: hypothetical protein R3A48_24940 [Polyangiales bacterium]